MGKIAWHYSSMQRRSFLLCALQRNTCAAIGCPRNIIISTDFRNNCAFQTLGGNSKSKFDQRILNIWAAKSVLFLITQILFSKIHPPENSLTNSLWCTLVVASMNRLCETHFPSSGHCCFCRLRYIQFFLYSPHKSHLVFSVLFSFSLPFFKGNDAAQTWIVVSV